MSHPPRSHARPHLYWLFVDLREGPLRLGLKPAVATSGLLVSVGWEFGEGPGEFWLRQSCGLSHVVAGADVILKVSLFSPLAGF